MSNMKNLKEKLNKKLRKNGGFTLVEMLVVVAIIAILVAVSIPVVSGALDGAKEAADSANERAAKAEAVMAYLGGITVDGYTKGSAATLHYDATAGKIFSQENSVTDKNYGQKKSGYIKVALTADGDATVSWSGDTP